MKKIQLNYHIYLSLVVMLLASGSASAALVSLDINGNNGPTGTNNGRAMYNSNFSGSGVLGGGTWNVIATTGAGTHTFSSLQESDGTATSVQVQVGSSVANGYAQQTPPSGFGQELIRDYLYMDHTATHASVPANRKTSTITLTGLNTMSGYVGGTTIFDIVIFGTDRSAGDASTYTIGGNSATVGVTDTTSLTAFTEGVDYARFNGVADSSGTISITWAYGGQRFSSFNGIQIQAVPEPSAALFGGLGLLFLLRRRRSN